MVSAASDEQILHHRDNRHILLDHAIVCKCVLRLQPLLLQPWFQAMANLAAGAVASSQDPCGANVSSTASGDSLDEWEEVETSPGPDVSEASLKILNNCLTDVQKFVCKVQEKCHSGEVVTMVKACEQLQQLHKLCNWQDRLIVAGNSNVGKSTIGNALLGGGKFWPTSSSCMTARICEAHYDASASGIAVSKDMVHKSATSQPKEFEEFLEQPLQVPNPSSLLKPGVILVDLPGLNQEKKYIDRLNEYLKSHPSSSVVLVYVLDVNDKICNSDHQFFVKLMSSPWTELSQKLLLVVNKCDIEVARNPLDSEEESPNYDDLISDIKTDASNYCTPKVMDVSMSDRVTKQSTQKQSQSGSRCRRKFAGL